MIQINVCTLCWLEKETSEWWRWRDARKKRWCEAVMWWVIKEKREKKSSRGTRGTDSLDLGKRKLIKVAEIIRKEGGVLLQGKETNQDAAEKCRWIIYVGQMVRLSSAQKFRIFELSVVATFLILNAPRESDLQHGSRTNAQARNMRTAASSINSKWSTLQLQGFILFLSQLSHIRVTHVHSSLLFTSCTFSCAVCVRKKTKQNKKCSCCYQASKLSLTAASSG